MSKAHGHEWGHIFEKQWQKVASCSDAEETAHCGMVVLVKVEHLCVKARQQKGLSEPFPPILSNSPYHSGCLPST